jgi:hypothetical protein
MLRPIPLITALSLAYPSQLINAEPSVQLGLGAMVSPELGFGGHDGFPDEKLEFQGLGHGLVGEFAVQPHRVVQLSARTTLVAIRGGRKLYFAQAGFGAFLVKSRPSYALRIGLEGGVMGVLFDNRGTLEPGRGVVTGLVLGIRAPWANRRGWFVDLVPLALSNIEGGVYDYVGTTLVRIAIGASFGL